jgi:hypothetical protein
MTYRNPVAKSATIIAHDYFDPSDNYGQYLADEKGCQTVTAAFCAQPNFYVETFWLLRNETLVLCESVDPRVDGSSVDIWTYNGACIGEVDPSTPVYVSKDALIRQGFVVPENTNEARARWKGKVGL